MEVYDPHACTARELDDCETTSQVNGLIPVLSTKDDQWFAISMLSGASHKLEDLDAEDLPIVREAIATHRFSKLLLSYCHQVQESGNAADKARCVLARVDYARHFGGCAVDEGERIVLERGFTAEDIGRAYTLMDAHDVVAEIPVTRVSDLRAEGKG